MLSIRSASRPTSHAGKNVSYHLAHLQDFSACCLSLPFVFDQRELCEAVDFDIGVVNLVLLRLRRRRVARSIIRRVRDDAGRASRATVLLSIFMPAHDGEAVGKQSAGSLWHFPAQNNSVQQQIFGEKRSRRASRHFMAYFRGFSNISTPSLRIAGVNLCAIWASSHGSVTSRRT